MILFWEMRIDPSYKIEKMAGINMLVRIRGGAIDMDGMMSLSEPLAWLFDRLSGRDFELEDMAELLQEEYDVDRDKAMTDCREIVGKLQNVGVIRDEQ